MISVCLASYNGGKYLREQVESILGQLKPSDELIISDDGSQDETLSIINSFKDSRIILVLNQGEHGVNANFENALRHAKGDFIFLSDQDDVWLPEKITECLRILKKKDLVIHDCYITDDKLKITSKSLLTELKAKKGIFNNIRKNAFTGCCMAFSRRVLDKSLPFPKSKLFYHDQWIGLMATLYFTTEFYNKPLIYFRRHYLNSSSAAKQSQYNITRKIHSRLSLIIALLLQYINK